MTTDKMLHTPSGANVQVSFKTPASQRKASRAFSARLKENNYEEYRKRQNEYMQRYRRKLKLKKLQAQRNI
tara:strand:- start:2699 stop:2911 length:213 start_codon:yes stop_codon:yes gene_type:complete